MNVQTSGPCIIKGCPEDGVCLDSENYTEARSELFPDELFKSPLVDDETSKPRQIWFCNTHAVKCLFPLIDFAVGNTTGQILEDFCFDEMM